MMKKLLNLKTLLAAAMLAGGVNCAKADVCEITAYSNTMSNTTGWTIKDSRKCYVKSSEPTGGHGGSATVQFSTSAALPLGATIPASNDYYAVDFYINPKAKSGDNANAGTYQIALYDSSVSDPTSSNSWGYMDESKCFFSLKLTDVGTDNSTATINGSGSYTISNQLYHIEVKVQGTLVTYTVTDNDGAGTKIAESTYTYTGSTTTLGGIYFRAGDSRIDDITVKYQPNHASFEDANFFAKVATFDLNTKNAVTKFNQQSYAKGSTTLAGFTDSADRNQIYGTGSADGNISGLKFGSQKCFNIYEGYGMNCNESSATSLYYTRNLRSTQIMEVTYKTGSESSAGAWSGADVQYAFEKYSGRETGAIKFPVSKYDYVTAVNVYEPLTASPTLSVTIGEAGYATFSAPCALNFSDISGLTAYTAAVNAAGTAITLTQVNDVPAETGVVLQGTAGTYNIPAIASSSTAQGSLTSALVRTVPASGNNYVLSKENGVVGFYKLPTNGAVQAQKAYLTIAGAARSFFGFDDNESTAIRSVENGSQATDNAVYNLHGQRVNNDRKGIVIINGKKFINK